jgi:hypothetical protein
MDAATEGILYKRRGGFGRHLPNNWQKRFFQLIGTDLLYHDDENRASELAPRGRLNLANNFIVNDKAVIEGAPTAHIIEINPVGWGDREDRWRVCAESKEEFVKWQIALKALPGMQQNQNQSSFTSPLSESTLNYSISSINGSRQTVMTGSAQVSAQSLSGGSTCADNFSKSPTTPLMKSNGRRSNFNRSKVCSRLSKYPSKNASDSIEMLTVLIIMNLCYFYGYLYVIHPEHKNSFNLWEYIQMDLITPTNFNLGDGLRMVLYIFLANFVVARTLILRSERIISTRDVDRETDTIGHDSMTPITESYTTTSGISSPSLDLSKKCPIGVTFNQSEQEAPNVPDHSWSRCDHRHFKVRQKNYSSTKQKASSGAPIYEPFAMDCFCTEARKDNISRLMDLDSIQGVHDIVDRLKSAKAPNVQHIPPVFVFQMQLPSEAPGLFGGKEDGPGWAMCVFFKLSDAALNSYCDPKSNDPPGYAFFAEWCAKNTQKSWKQRVKLIASALNLDEMGVSSFVSQFNSKPVLIRRTSSIFRGEGESLPYLELDIHVQKFDAMAQKSIVMMTSRANEMYMEIGILIEAREESELPELLIGCVGCNKPQEDQLQFIGV